MPVAGYMQPKGVPAAIAAGRPAARPAGKPPLSPTPIQKLPDAAGPQLKSPRDAPAALLKSPSRGPSPPGGNNLKSPGRGPSPNGGLPPWERPALPAAAVAVARQPQDAVAAARARAQQAQQDREDILKAAAVGGGFCTKACSSSDLVCPGHCQQKIVARLVEFFVFTRCYGCPDMCV